MRTSHAPVAPPAGGGTPAARTPLLAALAGLAMLVVSGVGSFALAGGYDVTSVDCGGNGRCIPALPLDAVAGALAAEGYECGAGEYLSRATTVCGLEIGAERMSVELVPGAGTADRIMDVRVRFEDKLSDGVRGEGARAFLAWSASLPFGDDPETVGEVTAWLGKRIDGGSGERVVIGGYDFWLEFDGTHRITLDIRVDHVPHHR